MTVAWNMLLILVGALLALGSFALREEEETRLAIFIKETSSRVREAEHEAVAKGRKVLQAICEALLRIVNHAFGQRPVSLHAVWSSFVLSAASVAGIFFFLYTVAFIILIVHIGPTAGRQKLLDDIHGNPSEILVKIWNCIRFILSSFSLATIPYFLKQSRNSFTRWLSIAAAFAIGFFAFIVDGGVMFMGLRFALIGRISAAAVLFLPITLGITCDLIFVALVRSALRNASQRNDLVGVLALLAFPILGLTLIVLVPLKLYVSLRDTGGLPWNALAGASLVVLLTDVFDLALGLTLICIGVLFALHRTIWAAIERPLAAINRLGIPRRWLFAAGLVLILIGLNHGSIDLKGAAGSFVGGLTKP